MSESTRRPGEQVSGKAPAEAMGSDEIREVFLEYFEGKDHERIRGSSLLPEDDPTLLFVNSGMAPLKPYFTGTKKPPHPDLCNVQPCIRTIDIDDVGDRHHLTLFEMMGSWSIGNYFKERAVDLAYELLTEKFCIPASKLYVTVYSGDSSLGLDPDDESARAWEAAGIPRDRIIYLREDNFWGPAGETGPCGPCTEVFYDTGDAYGPAYVPGGEFDTTKRYIEIWNAGVFMQFDKQAGGEFGSLPFNSVDTGSGVERMAMVLQDAPSVYETDLFSDLMTTIQQVLPANVPTEALRTIADHVRASCFILSEGVTPGNTGRSYIPRRLIRKCVALVARAGVEGFPYAEMIDMVVDRFGRHYTRLVEKRQHVNEAFLRETDEFERVIGSGLKRLEELCQQPAPFEVSAKDAFNLFSTYGLPIEISREFLKERGATVDDEGFAREFQLHQEISRSAGESKSSEWTKDASVVHAMLNGRSSEFVGYEEMECEGVVLGLSREGKLAERATKGDRVDVITDATPFYAESGGQVGDRGEIRTLDGAVLQVLDTEKVASVHVHRAEVLSGSVSGGDTAKLSVDEPSRRATMANHSATHLMHAALREVLGDHVRQAGSLVDSERLRFDFDHQQSLAPEELAEVERRVAESIQRNDARETVVTSYQEAVDAGALAFFGETYGESVRMVRFGESSTELCGGTHVGATGEIGQFRIVSESSIASGVRRILALTGKAAVRYTLEQDQRLRDLAALLKVSSADLPERVAQLLKKQGAAKGKSGGGAKSVEVKDLVKTLPSGFRCVGVRIDGDPKMLSQEALRIAKEISGAAVLVGEAKGKARLAIAVHKGSTDRCDASELLKALLPYIDGSGGGAPHLAQGGGDNAAGIDTLLNEIANHVESLEGSS